MKGLLIFYGGDGVHGCIGSGTSEKDVVDCEDQFQMNKRSLEWSRSSFIVPTVEARPWCVMGMPPTGSRSIAVTPVGVAAVSIRPPMPIPKPAVRRSCMLTKNVAACVASPAPLASHARPCRVGSKKSSSASPFPHDLGGPRPRGSHFHDTRTGRTVVVCPQKSE